MVRKVMPPSTAENERINRGIAADPDTFAWTTEEFAEAQPASEVLPRGLYEAAVKRCRGQRGPQKAPIKKAITLGRQLSQIQDFIAQKVDAMVAIPSTAWQRRR